MTKSCIGCGYCCVTAKCSAGVQLHGTDDNICEQLLWDEKLDRHVCRLMTFNNSLSDYYKTQLHAGAGCCSSLNSWRREPLQNRIPKKYITPQQTPLPPVMKILLECMNHDFSLSSDKIYLLMGRLKYKLLHAGMDDLSADDIVAQSVDILTQQKRSINIFGG